MSSKCHLLWGHIAIFPNGEVRPCCRFKMPEPGLSLLNSSFSEARNSAVFRTAKKTMLSGTLPESCIKCGEEERNGVSSLRQKSNLGRNLDDLTADAIAPLESIEWFLGNSCNLRCITCVPERSSSWNQDAIALSYEPAPLAKMNVDLLEPYISNLRKIKLIGGEPLLHKEHDQILEMIRARGVPKETHLVLNSNATIFPSARTLELWGGMKRVELGLSIDGVGAVNEYVRYPSSWRAIDSNLKKYLALANSKENIELYIICTLSALNVTRLSEIYLWWENFFERHASSQRISRDIYWNFVMDPAHFSPLVVPLSLRQAAITDLKSINPKEGAKLEGRLLKKGNESHLPRFIGAIRALDAKRGLALAKVLPELWSTINRQNHI